MTEAPMSYADFEKMVHDGLNDFQENLNTGIESVQRKFNTEVGEISNWEWAVKPWLVYTVNRGIDALQDAIRENWSIHSRRRLPRSSRRSARLTATRSR